MSGWDGLAAASWPRAAGQPSKAGQPRTHGPPRAHSLPRTHSLPHATGLVPTSAYQLQAGSTAFTASPSASSSRSRRSGAWAAGERWLCTTMTRSRDGTM